MVASRTAQGPVRARQPPWAGASDGALSAMASQGTRQQSAGSASAWCCLCDARAMPSPGSSAS
eukprot:10918075-Alexandrium_andersonii.AAC.1